MSNMIARRSFLGMLAACPICTAAAGAETDDGAVPQSPIDLSNAARSPKPSGLTVRYAASQTVTIKPYGYSFEVTTTAANSIFYSPDKIYELESFHFHHPAEHIASGGTHPMECHFVNKWNKKEVAVLGVFISAGPQENGALEKIWKSMPPRDKEGHKIENVNLNLLLPSNKALFRYQGSLTGAPFPSVQSVLWSIYEEPVAASPSQIAQFQAAYPSNARSIQPANGRPVMRFGA